MAYYSKNEESVRPGYRDQELAAATMATDDDFHSTGQATNPFDAVTPPRRDNVHHENQAKSNIGRPRGPFIILAVITTVLTIAVTLLLKDSPIAPAIPAKSSPMQVRVLKNVSHQPSFSPTAEPTFSLEISATVVFNQRLQVSNQLEFNETERSWFCQNMEGYTDDFGGRDDERVTTTCRIISQRLQIIGGRRRALRERFNYNNNSTKRRLQGVVFDVVEYDMTYKSKHTNVTWYPTLFQNHVNEDLDRLTTDLQLAGLKVTNSFLAFNNIATAAPSGSPSKSPSKAPSASPSISESPSSMPSSSSTSASPSSVPTSVPSSSPSERPSEEPTVVPTISFQPSTMPSASFPRSPDETAAPSSSLEPTVSPTMQSTSNKASIKIAAIVVTVLAASLQQPWF